LDFSFLSRNPQSPLINGKPMNEVVIVNALRTPIGRHGGALAAIRPDDLAALVIKAWWTDAGLDPALVEEVYFGCANQAGEDNRNVARMAALLAGCRIR
jgi:acetyl-CoA acetyltransferase